MWQILSFWWLQCCNCNVITVTERAISSHITNSKVDQLRGKYEWSKLIFYFVKIFFINLTDWRQFRKNKDWRYFKLSTWQSCVSLKLPLSVWLWLWQWMQVSQSQFGLTAAVFSQVLSFLLSGKFGLRNRLLSSARWLSRLDYFSVVDN